MQSRANWIHAGRTTRIVALVLLACGPGNVASAGDRPTTERAATPPRPNIVLIMADDMGYSDIGCYGGEIETPSLDALAAGGLRFAQFYNTGRCCPTRASLLTGLYPHQAGVGHMMEDRGLPGYRGDLNRRCVTIAEVLGTAGYTTLMAGKWHVAPPARTRENGPIARGFDDFYGTIHGGGSFYDPVTLTRGTTTIEPEADPYYYTDALSDLAAGFVREHGPADRPFFLYVAYTSPHWPLHAPEEDIATYQGRYDDGWDALRAERHRRMIDMGLVEGRWPLSPRDPDAPPWEEAEHKDWQARRMEVYAAMIDRMDQGIGRIVGALEQAGELEDTLILFLADNGGCAENLGPNASGLHITRETRDGRPVRVGNDPSVMPGPEDTYQSYGLPWANASNTPFRLYKHWVHEGGISTPLIAHWPSGIEPEGAITQQPGHLIDIMATCVDLAGADYPVEFAGHDITPLEGKSLRPIFEGQQRDGHEALFWEHEGNRAVRRGHWKLVARYREPWSLYDMEADRTEQDDLADEHPEIASELAARYEQWAERANVVPWEEVTRPRADAGGGIRTRQD